MSGLIIPVHKTFLSHPLQPTWLDWVLRPPGGGGNGGGYAQQCVTRQQCERMCETRLILFILQALLVLHTALPATEFVQL